MKRSALKRGTSILKRTPMRRPCLNVEDAATSFRIRSRDIWTCVRCKRKFEPGDKRLTCSHFFNRRKASVRHDGRNLDSLCASPCHVGQRDSWEYQKHEGGEYYNFKLAQLGAVEFENLRLLSEKI